MVNVSTGIVKDIVFSEGESPPENLPLMIVVEYPCYDGPPFFNNVINPITLEVVEIDRNGFLLNHSPHLGRKTVRLHHHHHHHQLWKEQTSPLAWAWTPWKGQGATNRGFCVMNPGDSESSPGICYVMISRVTSIF